MSSRIWGRALAGWLLLWCALPGVAGAASADQARAFTDQVAAKALAIITDAKATKAGKQKKLEELFAASVDIPWVGRFVLGRYWRQASAEQRAKYLKEYSGFLTSHYAGRFADYSGGHYQITDVKKNEDDDDQYRVLMEIISSDGKTVLVEYRVHPDEQQKLRFFDVSVEGVSMIATQRSEFSSVVNDKGLDYLIDQLASHTLEITTKQTAEGQQ